MMLTKEDREWLMSLSHRECDLPKIEAALHTKRTTYSLEGKPASRVRAIRLLGRECYLAGISRSAFHYTAVQATGTGETVYFDSCKLFKRRG